MAQALYAQCEGLKRNTPVRLTVTAHTANVSVMAFGEVLRQHTLTKGLSASEGTLDVGANGLPAPLGTACTPSSPRLARPARPRCGAPA
jgi:hypothetical protein